MEKIIIYRKNEILYTTTEENYDKQYADARKIYRWDGFTSPTQIIEYCKQYDIYNRAYFVDKT